MIYKLNIKNFKVHADTTLALKNLNILSGVNGSGKSSIIQSLLLLRQSFEKGILSKGLDLNKPHCEIGTFNDALYQYAETLEDIITFSIDFIENQGTPVSCVWQFKPEKNALNKTFVPLLGEGPSGLEEMSLFNRNFQYLSAARFGPRESHPLNTYQVEENKQISIEKGQGELAVHFLYYYGQEKKEKISGNLLNEFSTLDDLLSQTSAWEREISPNVNVIPSLKGKSLEIKFSFNKPNDITATNEFTSDNVGYGLSYALPIIISALSAGKGSLLLIENPEAHLHSKGQAKLAELLSLAASNGVQIIVETHSDHFINGVLIACKKFEQKQKGIDRNLVKIFNFRRDEATHSAKVEEIEILEDGKISSQPEGFFDQSEKDLKYLLGF